MLAAIAGSLSFCASEPIPINYYLLSGNAPQGVTVQAAENKKTLVLETVQVADFLRQSGIVMQTAEPLGRNARHRTTKIAFQRVTKTI